MKLPILARGDGFDAGARVAGIKLAGRLSAGGLVAFQAPKNDDDLLETLKVFLGYRSAYVAVESAVSGLDGARATHNNLAQRFGYHVYRIIQNAYTFGVAQSRPRSWAVFAKRPRFGVWHSPRVVTVGDVLTKTPRDFNVNDDARLKAQRSRITKTYGRGAASKYLRTPGRLSRLVHKSARVVGSIAHVLDPNGFAPSLTFNAWWIYRGRNVAPSEYRALMGFPASYKLDRAALSASVVPSVAAWLFELLTRNAAGDVPANAEILNPGETADYRISKANALRIRAGFVV